MGMKTVSMLLLITTSASAPQAQADVTQCDLGDEKNIANGYKKLLRFIEH
jgi:hypothetical protein